MAGGFLSGLVVGAVMSGVGLGAASVLTGPVASGEERAPGASVVDVPAGSEFNQTRDDVAALIPEVARAPAPAGQSPKVPGAAPDDLSAMGGDETVPMARPETASVVADLSAPQVSGGGDAGAAVTEDEGAATRTTISADPAQPSQPTVETGAFATAARLREEEPDADDPQERADTPADAQSIRLPSSPPDAGTGARRRTVGGLSGRADAQSVSDKDADPADQPRGIEAFAADFDSPEGKPLMSIVLIDDGSGRPGPEALDDFPFPLSFAVDANAPDAAEAMTRYRDAGFEVLAIADVPKRADARDAETTIETLRAAMPEAAAILEGTDAEREPSRAVTRQPAPILRDVSDESHDDEAMRRALDQAALKAGQAEGGVIVLGRASAGTIRALILWGQQKRAGSVALAPISTVLTAQD